MEATKRVARALVRVIFRELYALQQADADPVEAEEAKVGESDVASGATRSERSHSSDASPSSLRSKEPPRSGKVKVRKAGRSRTERRRKTSVSKKIA